jgi:hypothetical protein
LILRMTVILAIGELFGFCLSNCIRGCLNRAREGPRIGKHRVTMEGKNRALVEDRITLLMFDIIGCEMPFTSSVAIVVGHGTESSRACRIAGGTMKV